MFTGTRNIIQAFVFTEVSPRHPMLMHPAQDEAPYVVAVRKGLDPQGKYDKVPPDS